MLKKYAPYILSASLFILGSSFGFFIGRTTTNTPPSDTITQIPTESTKNQSIYSSQTASIRGEITKKDGDILTVRNLNTQTSGTIKASPRVIIAKAGTLLNQASPSSDLSKLELNKEVLITLQMVTDRYEATTIQYVIPAPSLPPIVNTAT